MELPKWLELVLFIGAWSVALMRLRFGLKVYMARQSIFGGGRRYYRLGLIANTGYALTAALLGLYFLFSYLNHAAATLMFGFAVGFLIVVAILEIIFRNLDLKSG